MNTKMAIAHGTCFIGVALRAAEMNAVIEATGVAATNTVCDAVEAMSPELRAWIVWMNDLVQKSGLKADVDEKGMFRMRFGFADGRKQFVYVESGFHEEDGYRTIHVCSSAYCGELTKAMAMQLLATTYSIGFWHIEPCAENLGKYEVLFSAQLPETVKPNDFKAVCGIVAQRADNREAAWRDQDEQ